MLTLSRLIRLVVMSFLSVIVFTTTVFGSSGGNELLTPAEQLWLKENQARIVLAVETDYPPFVFLDSKKQPSGLAHDYLLLLQSKVGVQFNQKQFSSLEGIFAKVRLGGVQIVNAVTKTPKRSKFLLFTEPFISVPNVILVRRGQTRQMVEKDLAGLKVSLVKSYAITEHLSKLQPGLKIDLAPDDLSALLSVSFGRSDAAVIDLATASYLITSKGITNLRVAGEASFGINLSLAVPHTEPVLYGILQKSLQAITAEERLKIHGRWIHLYEKDALTERQFRIGAAVVLLGGLGLFAIVVLWNRLLRRQVAQHTAELLREKEILRLSEEHHRTILQSALSGIWLLDLKGQLLEVNKAYCTMSGYSAEELLSMNIADLDAMETAADVAARLQKIMETGEIHFESCHRRKDGTLFDVEVSAQYLRNDGEKCIVFLQDITERKKAAEAIWTEKAFLRSLIDSATDLIYFKDINGRYLGCNKATEAFTGSPEQEQIGKTDFELLQKELAVGSVRSDRKVFQEGVAVRCEEWATSASGARMLFDTIKTPIFGLDGNLIGLVGISRDITEARRAEASLQEARRLQAATEKIGKVGGWEFDLDTMMQTWTDEVYRIHDVDMTYSPKVEIGLSFYTSSSRSIIETAVQRAIEYGEPFDLELEIVTAKGALKSVKVIGQVDLDRRKVAGLIQDITERKQLEAERAKIEAQLYQILKVEAVGRLAGGIAHDFNNMLSVILGHTELALMQMDQNQPLYSSLSEIRKAAQRSADLTRQLLAFARKQTVSPKVIDLNETVAGMLKMLQRLIGENMQLTWQPGASLWPVMMDCSQVDQIMANLCVNARDAIANVGRIIIETGNCSIDEHYCSVHPYALPGEYVKITVSDDGKGMDPETLEHIFEPFFTTKVVGEGTGLGLATVYGIVRQNNGFINVYSEPGTGTTFTIYLPRYQGETEEAQQEGAPESSRRGHETILLVEDEAQILEMTALILTELGYRVLKANGPGEALRLARDYSGEIDLLITDVIMPEMNGRDLANKLNATYPQLKCLFMSGYTADIIAHHGVLEEGVQFIQKPFRMNDLATKLREVLNGLC